MSLDPGNEGVPDSSRAAIVAHLDQATAEIADVRRKHELTDQRVASIAVARSNFMAAMLLRHIVDGGMCVDAISQLADELDYTGRVATEIGFS